VVLLQLCVVGYSNIALSRQFVSNFLLSIVVLIINARWSTSSNRSVWSKALGITLLGTTFALMLSFVKQNGTNNWQTIKEKVACYKYLASEFDAKKVVLPYWSAIPVSIYVPNLIVDNYIADIIYLSPRVRNLKNDPVPVDAYAVETGGVSPKRLEELFGPADKEISCQLPDGGAIQLVSFQGGKYRTYLNWISSYAPEISGGVAKYDASTLTHLLKPQFSRSYVYSKDVYPNGGRLVGTYARLPEGTYRVYFVFDDIERLDYADLSVEYKGTRLHDQKIVRAPGSKYLEGQFTIAMTNSYSWKEMYLVVPPGSSFTFNHMLIVKK
jgi:hypothetical protein